MRGMLAIPFILVLLGACSTPDQAPTPDRAPVELTGKVWRWVGTDGADPPTVDHPSRYTIEFTAEGRYSVRADCNSGQGSWTRRDGAFALVGGPMTMAACGESSLDQQFLGLLASASSARREGEALLLTAGAATMRLEAMAEVGLAGTAWLVHACNNGRGAVTSILADSELTIEFGDDGQVAGEAGCNRFTGSYQVAGQTIGFSPLATTRRMCMGEGVDEQEQAFLAALASVGSWEIRGERAQLRAADGGLAVDLVSAVTGVALVRTRQALPPDAVLTVQVQDVSVADAAAKILGEHSRTLDGTQSPFPFQVSFDPAEIDPRMSCAVRVTVHSADGQLMFTTTEHHPVLTRDGGQFGIELTLQAAGE